MTDLTRCQKNIIFKKGLEALDEDIKNYLGAKKVYNDAVNSNVDPEHTDAMHAHVDELEVHLASKFFDYAVAAEIAMQGLTQYFELENEEENDGS